MHWARGRFRRERRRGSSALLQRGRDVAVEIDSLHPSPVSRHRNRDPEAIMGYSMAVAPLSSRAKTQRGCGDR